VALRFVRWVHRVRQRRRGLTRTRDLINALEELRGAYANFYCELTVTHGRGEWATAFRLRGEIPWRERRYTLRSDSSKVSLSEHLERTVAMLREKVLVLHNRV